MDKNKVNMVPMPKSGWRILGFGVDEAIGIRNQNLAREAGLRADVLTLANDEASDKKLITQLAADKYDGVIVGGKVSAQMPDTERSYEQSQWFNRLLNLIIEHSPGTKIILALGPDDAVPAVTRILGNYSNRQKTVSKKP